MGDKIMEVEKKIKRLPPNLQREVLDFIDFLLEKEKRKPKRKPTLKWVGALKHLRDKYTSVELQHKILEWWIRDELDRH